MKFWTSYCCLLLRTSKLLLLFCAKAARTFEALMFSLPPHSCETTCYRNTGFFVASFVYRHQHQSVPRLMGKKLTLWTCTCSHAHAIMLTRKSDGLLRTRPAAVSINLFWFFQPRCCFLWFRFHWLCRMTKTMITSRFSFMSRIFPHWLGLTSRYQPKRKLN